MSEEEKKIKNVQEMFEDIPIKDIESQSITIYGTAILDVIEVLNLIEKQEKEIESSISKDNIKSLLKQVNASLYHFKDSDKNNIMQRIKDKLEQLLEE